jgi:hypothetical protein
MPLEFVTCAEAIRRYGAEFRRDIEVGFWTALLELRGKNDDPPIEPRSVIEILQGQGDYLPNCPEDGEDHPFPGRAAMVEGLLVEYRTRPPCSEELWRIFAPWVVELGTLGELRAKLRQLPEFATSQSGSGPFINNKVDIPNIAKKILSDPAVYNNLRRNKQGNIFAADVGRIIQEQSNLTLDTIVKYIRECVREFNGHDIAETGKIPEKSGK